MGVKRALIAAFLPLVLTHAFAQDYSITVGNTTTEITFYSPEIVRVTKYQKSDILGKSDPKVVVTMNPQTVNPTKRESEWL